MLHILETKPSSAEENMLMDQQLLESIDKSSGPILHLYEWEVDSITYGYFIKPQKYLKLDEINKRKIQLARRPTGGGIVFHIWDLAFSFLMPANSMFFSLNSLENYHFVNEIVKKAVQELFQINQGAEIIQKDFQSSLTQEHFCMAKPTKYDVVLNGQKIAGAAQRKKKKGYLHQGTISLAMPKEDLLSAVLVSEKNVKQAMKNFSFCPLQGDWSQNELELVRFELRELLIKYFKELF